VTVTGTENLMMAAALAEGTTVIDNAAREHEVADLARLLGAMGARIDGAGTERIEIQGVPELGGARHRIIPDRIEAGTLLVAGAITGGDVTVTGVVPRHLTATLAKLEECGVAIEVGDDRVRARATGRPAAADVITTPPTCRRSSWRCSASPTGRRRSPRRSSRTG
jgi:UDP-N-acetylglucosamine 1-carboxyvinyltransferase